MRLLIAAFAALLALLLPGAAAAEERILSFDSQIAILPDGMLDVTETIHVRVENVAINHGIYRDFPTRYDAPSGRRVQVGFQLDGTWLDGQPEPAKVESLRNGVRIRIGSAGRTVAPGEHSYTIRYRATRMIGRFKDYDELYWNVTGNGWAFPIDRASATITLPSPTAFSRPSAYTGQQGSTASDATVTSNEPGSIRFMTTRPLYAGEGLTVAAAFPKGTIAPPGTSTRLAWFLSDWAPPLIGAVGLGAVLIYLFHAWRVAGRDPRPGTVVPLFSPPDDLSPAATRYVVEQNLDNRGFAAALVDMGVRGHVRMVEEDASSFSGDAKWIMNTLSRIVGVNRTRLDRLPATSPLPAEEEAALRELAVAGESIVMEQKNHAKFSAAKKALSKGFAKRFEGKLFNRNYGWAGAAVVIWLAVMWLTAVAIVLAESSGNRVLALLSCSGLAIAALVFHAAPSDKSAGRYLLQIIALVIGVGAVVIGLPVIAEALKTGRIIPFAIPLVALPFVISSFWWMSAPTREGRAVLDRIAGFKQYLSITERERLDRMHPPEDTPELFERFLPYAIALGVETRWGERFEGVLAAAAASGQQGFAWYSGSSSPWDNPAGFADTVGSSLSNTISSASTAPGSSSGSGGGGSSGGGGGGGGGGGW